MTDPEARLARKGPGKPAMLAYQASVMTDNRHGLVVATAVGLATGTAEVEQAEIMLGAVTAEPAGRTGHRTVGADKLYDQRGFVRHRACPYLRAPRRPGGDGPARQSDRPPDDPPPGLRRESAAARLVEESFGWARSSACSQAPDRGVGLVDAVFTFTMATYNLVRLRTLTEAGVWS